MAMIDEVNIDVSKEFKELSGTVVLTHIIRQEGLPTGALIVDHKTKDMYIYEYVEGEITITLRPIEDDNVRGQLQMIIERAMETERE